MRRWPLSAISKPHGTTAPIARAKATRFAGPDCTIVLNMPWDQALDGIEQFERLDILYWLHQSRRDLVLQNPKHAEAPRGTFSLRSPIRPNPIGLSNVQLVRRDGTRLIVRGLECVSGTPLIDIKPDRCQFTPVG